MKSFKLIWLNLNIFILFSKTQIIFFNVTNFFLLLWSSCNLHWWWSVIIFNISWNVNQSFDVWSNFCINLSFCVFLKTIQSVLYSLKNLINVNSIQHPNLWGTGYWNKILGFLKDAWKYDILIINFYNYHIIFAWKTLAVTFWFYDEYMKNGQK